MQMTSMENFLQLFRGGASQWIPFTLDVGAIRGFAESIQRKFETETGQQEPAEYFDFDFRIVSLSSSFGGKDPGKYHRDFPTGTKFDEWGIGHWAGGAKDTYEKIFPPLASAATVEEIEKFPEPVISTKGVRSQVAEYHARGYPVVGYAGSIYEWSWWLRGLEQFMVDLLQAPHIAKSILEKASRFTCRLALETAGTGVDVLAFYDDAGMQTGMQISPLLWRTFVKPCWKKVLDTIRAKYRNSIFFFHCCGNIYSIVPDIVELGFHILHPLQPECMDTAAIKTEYGNKIVLCGTLGAQHTLSFGSLKDVRRETIRIMDTLGADRRCILCPSNIIQPETPWENIMAFAETAREHPFGKIQVRKKNGNK